MVLRGEGASKEYRILMVIETTVSNDKRNSTNNVKCKPFFSLPFVGVCVCVTERSGWGQTVRLFFCFSGERKQAALA